MKKVLIILVCILLLAALLFYGVMSTTKEAEVPVENAGTAQHAVVKKEHLTYQGTEYPMKDHLETVLLIGTDSAEQYQEKDNFLQDYYNFNQADFLLLLVLDKDANTAQIIQLNRDTMTEVPWLDVLGNYGGTEFKQLCLSFNSGDGGMKSCKNTVDAVTKLIWDAPIQHYIQIPLSAIAMLNDVVGGVPVVIPEDLTVVDPSFVEGTTVHLNGVQAEKFVRSRMALEDDTNTSRMRRQRIYLDSFQTQAQKAFNSDSNFALKLVEKLSEHMQSSLTVQQFSDLMEQLDKAVISPIRTPDGELIVGAEFYEFYVDENSLWELVKSAYCEQ